MLERGPVTLFECDKWTCLIIRLVFFLTSYLIIGIYAAMVITATTARSALQLFEIAASVLCQSWYTNKHNWYLFDFFSHRDLSSPSSENGSKESLLGCKCHLHVENSIADRQYGLRDLSGCTGSLEDYTLHPSFMQWRAWHCGRCYEASSKAGKTKYK